MQRIDNSSAATTLPAPRPAGTPGYFTEGDPLAGTEPTIVDQDFMNSVQEELCNVITAAAITLDKTNRAQLLAALNRLFLPRVLVTSNLTLYVNPTTGNDANNGLSPTSAYQTIRAAINAMYGNYNFNGNYGCTIQLADGTYNYAVSGGFAAPFSGQPLGMPRGAITLLGNTSNPDAVQITATNGNAIGAWATQITVNGVSVTGTGNTWSLNINQGIGIAGQQGAWINLLNWRAKNCGMFPVRVDNGSMIAISGANGKVTGTGQNGFYAGGGGMIWMPSTTLDVTSFATTYGTCVCDQARIETTGMTFTGSGSCTGPRYSVINNGVIVTNGGGANYLPGNAAGAASSGGQYT